jgi:FtsP/CotA-like multicopper oxidase with cupredoxin domain
MSGVSRRQFLGWGLPGVASLVGAAALAGQEAPAAASSPAKATTHEGHLGMPGAGRIPELHPPGSGKQVDPMLFLTHFDWGTATPLPGGRTLREWTLTALDREIVVAPGVTFPAWTYNGSVPAPTLRCRVGDVVRVKFFNEGSHAHSIHFHGIHPANMDGVFEQVPPGKTYTYEFEAEPFGVFLYHCHTMPLTQHIHKGLYGAFIVDPPKPRPPARELVMVMNGFDTNMDGKNEFYTVNGIANYYVDHPIPLRLNELVRIYLVNLLEFDMINSFHLHANMFRYYPTGTDLERYEYTDTVMLAQGERGLMEFAYKYPGRYMFHAHKTEFAELGWNGFFEVQAAEARA